VKIATFRGYNRIVFFSFWEAELKKFLTTPIVNDDTTVLHHKSTSVLVVMDIKKKKLAAKIFAFLRYISRTHLIEK